MKYQTAVFDVNTPTDKQIQVPLNSDYGVAVKVKKDGEYVAEASITLDSEQPNGVYNGWTLFQRATDGLQGTELLAVEANKAPSLSAYASATLKHTTLISADTRLTMNTTVTGISENLHIESPTWLARPEVKIVFTSQDGSTTERRLTGADLFYITNARGVVAATWNGSTSKWELSPTLNVIYPNSKLRLNLIVPANSTAEADAVVKVDSGDGFDSEFSLVVQEQDLGYIEASNTSPAGSYDVQYVGLSPDDLGEEVVFANGTVSCDLWFQTNATDLDGKLFAYAVYNDPSDLTPYVTGSFDVALQSGLAKTTIDDVSELCPEVMTSYYVKTWIQDEDYVDPGVAIGEVLDWTAYRQA